MNRNKELSKNEKQKVYKEQLLININPKNLLNKHIFMVFEKEKDAQKIEFRNEEIIKGFDEIM
jgi:hypothetical protein